MMVNNMKPTDKSVEWPENIYGWNGDLNQKFSSMRDISLNFSTQNNSGNAIEYIRADLAQLQFTPEQLQSVMEALEIGKQYTGRDVRISSMCANDKESSWNIAMDRVMSAAIALLKGMK